MTTHIFRLLRGLLLMASLAIVACTNERQDETFPDRGNPTSTERRAVLITLKNKLALLPPGGAATRGIATSAENAIASLDVYAFGADQEDGTLLDEIGGEFPCVGFPPSLPTCPLFTSGVSGDCA